MGTKGYFRGVILPPTLGGFFTSRGFFLPPLLGELFVSPLIVFDINRESSPAALGGFILPPGGLFYLQGVFITSTPWGAFCEPSYDV